MKDNLESVISNLMRDSDELYELKDRVFEYIKDEWEEMFDYEDRLHNQFKRVGNTVYFNDVDICFIKFQFDLSWSTDWGFVITLSKLEYTQSSYIINPTSAKSMAMRVIDVVGTIRNYQDNINNLIKDEYNDKNELEAFRIINSYFELKEIGDI